MIKMTCETTNEVKYLIERLGDDITRFEVFIDLSKEKVYHCYSCKTILTETQCKWAEVWNIAWTKIVLPLCDTCFELYEERIKESTAEALNLL